MCYSNKSLYAHVFRKKGKKEGRERGREREREREREGGREGGRKEEPETHSAVLGKMFYLSFLT